MCGVKYMLEIEQLRPIQTLCTAVDMRKKLGSEAEKKAQHRGFKFDVLLTVHLGIIFVNNQINARIFSCIFISIPYMFRASIQSDIYQMS